MMIPAELDLSGHVAVVTGSGRNIGRAIALELAAHGANIIVNSASDSSAARQVADEVESHGSSAYPFVGDVSDPEVLQNLFDAGRREFGLVDIVVSNANVRLHKTFDETTIDDWHRHLNMQLTTSFRLAKLFIPGMKEAGWGRIVHVNGPDGWYGGRMRLPSSAGKAGLRNLTKSLAAEFGQHGITVNDLVPGPVDTVRDAVTHPELDSDSLRRLAEAVPTRRLVDPREIAWACLWLCSERSASVTGIALHVDGGWKMLG